MNKRTKILLAIVAVALVIGLATGAFTFGDIVSSLIGERVPQIESQYDVQENIPGDSESIDDLLLTEDEPEQLQTEESEPQQQEQLPAIDENGSYTSKEDVALYIHTYGRLPKNFITKNEARDLGWEGGSIEDYAPGCSIGGDRFGNYEGILPEGKKYTECDIDTLGRSSRGSRRIVFSNDGCIYYTDDHYETFELLYGEE
ncbi:MAG: ribonuclease [Clostridia bacterium]|nr:ribonuclease [Clostridia bacterium]